MEEKQKKFSEKEYQNFLKNPAQFFENYKNLIKENKSLTKAFESLTKKNESLTKKNKSLTKKNKSLTKKTQEKEAIIQQITGEQIYIIDKTIYKEFDSIQTNEVKMKEEADKKEAEDMFQKFKGYIELIDVVSDNTGSKDNHDDSEDTKEDAQILLPSEEINEIIKHKFGKDLEINEFLEAFRKAINININQNWIKDDRIAFKSKLNDIVDSLIRDIFFKDIPNHIMQLRMDNLLCSTLTKVYKPAAKTLDFLIIKASVNYTSIPLIKGIKFYCENHNEILFDKNYIKKQINNNVGVLNAYYKLIQKFVTSKFDKKKLKETINKIVDDTNIYFIDLPRKVLGVTICNGDIFISGKFLQEAITNKNNYKYYNLIGASKIFLTLLHEIAHKLQYTIRMTCINDDNYFIKTFYIKKEDDLNYDLIETIQIDNDKKNYEFKEKIKLDNSKIEDISSYEKLHGTKTRCESGDFFDEEIYIGKEQKFVSKSISEFFVLSACENYRDFIEIMYSIFYKIDNDKDKKERIINSNYKIVGDEKVYCYHSYVRGNKLNY